ncbi:MAG: POTRA domain-containing protein [Balneolaceae bacterium]
MHAVLRWLFLLVGCFLLALPSASHTAVAQNGAQLNNSNDSSSQKVVRVVRFSGNRSVRTSELRALVRTDNNREFLGIPRFTPWYFLHRAIGIGESPAFLDREMVASDRERVELFYENLGFFEVQVDTSIIEFQPNRVEVSFIIEEGPRSRLNTISYSGLPDFEDDGVIDRFYSESLYRGSMANDSTFQVNRPYSTQELREEQTRIINFLKNRGYASVQRDSVQALLKPSDGGPNQFDVLYSITPGSFYTFGDVFITLKGPEGNEGYDDSLRVEGEPHTIPPSFIDMKSQRSAQTQFSLLTDQLRFTPGAPFNQEAYIRTVNSFQNLDMLFTNRFALNADGALVDFSRPEIPVYFDLQTVPKHSIRTEFFGMRRFGFGTGLGVNYNNNNLRGRADNLNIGVNTSLEFVGSGTLPESFDVRGSTVFQSYEVRADYTLPRLTFPFQRFDDRSWVRNSRTQYGLSYVQSNQLFFDINSDVRFNMRFVVNHNDQFTSMLDLIEMDVIDADLSNPFRQTLTNEFGENSVEFLRIEEDFRPQFSSILRYTLRSRNTDIIKRNFGHSAETAIAVGGNLPWFIDRFISGPGDVTGTLPSPFGISSNNLAYSRFLKWTGDYRRYFDVHPNNVVAFRLFAGVAQPLFDSTTIPLSRRFFAGGSNDIRGWNAFQLGPGAIATEDVTVQGGEVKLAAFSEIRQTMVQQFLNGRWIFALHADAGNIWYGPRTELLDEDGNDLLADGRFKFDSFFNQIAVGSGFGLRIDWEFLIARFDLTYRVHDLQLGWFNDGTPYFSFGIGHAF